MSTSGLGLLGTTTEEQRKLAAWEKAAIVPEYDLNHARKDAFGWWIVWGEYGNRLSPHGWEIDHILPVSRGGTDAHSNLRALHWRVNAGLGGLLSGLGR